ncbi:gliding motility-associated C-terminal domain-containing protein [Flavobacteriales bacterium]|nr:gliding motility-associated C-terminal domain-containing protein [Flavobacteriales bacterium]
MRKKFIRRITLLRMILFLFLGVFSVNKTIYAQSLTNIFPPQGTQGQVVPLIISGNNMSFSGWSCSNTGNLSNFRFSQWSGTNMFYGSSTSSTPTTLTGTVNIGLGQAQGVYDLEVYDCLLGQWVILPNSFLVNSNNGQCITGNTQVCYGDSTNLCVGAGLETILWTNNINPNFSDTNACVWVAPDSATTYYVEAQDSSGTCNDTITVMVNNQINITASVIPPTSNAQINCFGQIFPIVSPPPNIYTYQWDTSGSIFSNNQNIITLCENTYCLTVTEPNGCFEDSCFNVEWNPCELTDSIFTPIQCNGGTGVVQLTIDTTAGIGPIPYNPFLPRFIVSTYSVNPYVLISTTQTNLTQPLTPQLFANDYIISVYDRSWEDSCYTNVTLTEPDPIIIYTSVNNTSQIWLNDGSIVIDSITGGTTFGGTPQYTWQWYDSSYVNSPPGTPIQTGGDTLDSLFYSHDYFGGYSISLTDSLGCNEDTTLFVYPYVNNISIIDTAISHITCFGFHDGEITVIMNDTLVPPMYYYWVAISPITYNGTAFNTGDTIRVDSVNTLFYDPANPHIVTLENLSSGWYRLDVYDFFQDENQYATAEIQVIEADSIYVVIEPNIPYITDSTGYIGDSLVINCGDDTLLTATAFPLPETAQLMSDTNLVLSCGGQPSFILDFSSGLSNGETYCLYDPPVLNNRKYMLECSLLNNNPVTGPNGNYDPAFSGWVVGVPSGGPGTTPFDSTWSWNNYVPPTNGIGIPPRPDNDVYNGVNHTYTWTFDAQDYGAIQDINLANTWKHEFAVELMTGLNGAFQCQVFSIIDTVIYSYEWTTVGNPGVILSTSDTLLTDNTIITTVDYVVQITNTNGCTNSDTIRVAKNLHVLASDSIIVTDVEPCFGDLTGEIEIFVDSSFGIAPYTYSLYDVDTNLIIANSTSSVFATSTGTPLGAGIYILEIQDFIGCLGAFTDTVLHPDTIYACGVNTDNDTTFNVAIHTVIANDSTTWDFTLGPLVDNFQYYLEVSGTFGLTSLQQNAPYWEDAAFETYTTFPSALPMNRWTINGDVLRPDTDVYNSSPSHTYKFHYPLVNGVIDSTYFVGTNSLFGYGVPLNISFDGDVGGFSHNQGSLTFRLHKISCYRIDTAYTCKSKGLGMAYIRPFCPECGIDDFGGVPFDPDENIIGDEYYKTAWVAMHGIAPNPYYVVGDTVNASTYHLGSSDTIVGLYAGFYHVIVEDSYGCTEFVRFLNVLEPIDSLATVIDTVIEVSCKNYNTGEIHLSNFGGFNSNALGWDSPNEDGSGGFINTLSISSKVSRYTVLLRDTVTSYNPCANNTNGFPNADYSDTIAQIYSDTIILNNMYVNIDTIIGSQDSIIFNELYAGRYRVFVYDSIPDAVYGKFDPFTGNLLDSSFNYFQCPTIHDVYIKEPCDSLLSVASVINHITCWGDSTGIATVQSIGGTQFTFGSPYTYHWHNAPFGSSLAISDTLGETTATAYHLWADTLLPFPSATWNYVTTTDAHGCERTDSVKIEHMYEKIRPFYIDNIGTSVYAINLIEDSVRCYGDCDGEAALSTIGGELPHTYTWDVLEPGNSGLNHTSMNQPDTVDYLCAGGHDILVVDNKGCEAVVRFRIDEPNQIYAIATITTPISCFGYNDGSAQVWGIGGNDIPPSVYTYSWQLDPTIYSSLEDSLFWATDTNNLGHLLNNQSAQYTDSLLPPGIHIVTVYDYKGCFASDTVEFIEPDLLTLEFTDSVYAYCEFTESASLCVQAYGGTENYTYQFNDLYHQNNTGNATGINNPFCANNLTPININTAPLIPLGDYYVTVIDERGCFADNYINIDSVTNSFNTDSVDYISQNVSCFNGSNGSIDITNVTGGMGNFPSGYTITWTGPSGYANTLFNISSLEAGSYAATISDSAVGAGPSCDITINILITEPEQLLVTIYDTTGTTCMGDAIGSCDGQIMVSITGGTPLVDASGSSYYEYDVDEFGIYPFTNTDTVHADTLIDDLCAGIHTIYITDANGCEGFTAPGGISTATLDIGVFVTVNVPLTWDASCSNVNDGEAEVSLPDPILDYTWETDPIGPNSEVGIGTSQDSLLPGDYWLVAHYSPASNFNLPIVGCDAAVSFEIESPDAIVVSSSTTSPLCWGQNNGSINITVSGGSPSYTYSWTGPNGFTDNSEDISGLGAGTYAVTVTDSEGCQTTEAILVNQPDQLQANFTTEPASCNGDDDGVITASVSGGTFSPPVVGNNDFTWTSGTPVPFGGPTSLTWNASAGIYIVTITDDNGCKIEDISIVVGEPDMITVTLNSNIEWSGYGVSCADTNNGEILAITSGGTPPLSYSWTDPTGTVVTTGNPATGLFAGMYNVTITDSETCVGEADEDFEITEPLPIEITAEIIDASCNGRSDGEITITAEGGITNPFGAYNYYWSPSVSHPNNNDGSIAINLMAGSFMVTVEALEECSNTASFDIDQPLLPFESVVYTVNYAGPGNAPYSIDFKDETPYDIEDLSYTWCWDYVIEWDAAEQAYDTTCIDSSYFDFSSTTRDFDHEFNNIGDNDIYVMVEYINGCTHKTPFQIKVQGMPDINNVFSPNGDGINDVFSIGEFGMDNMSVSILNRWGEEVYSWEGDGGKWDGKGVDGQTLSEGVYFYVLKATGMDGYYYEEKGSITLLR